MVIHESSALIQGRDLVLDLVLRRQTVRCYPRPSGGMLRQPESSAIARKSGPKIWNCDEQVKSRLVQVGDGRRARATSPDGRWV